MNNCNYYELLELDTNASFEDIRKAYQRARKSYANDSMSAYSLFSESQLSDIVEGVEEAYMVLSDYNRRDAYDLANGFKEKANMKEASFVLDQDTEYVKNVPPPIVSGLGDTFFVGKKGLYEGYVKDPETEEWIKNCEEFSGNVLTKIREYKNIEIKALSDYSKIGKRHIANIEKEEFSELPAKPYLRGFVAQLAKALKLDGEKVAKSYMKRVP